MLNVVIEAHFIELGKYEITVKTAKKSNHFRFGEGQYVLEMFDSQTSILKKLENGRIITVHQI